MGWDPKNDTANAITIPLVSISDASGAKLARLLSRDEELNVDMDIIEVTPFDPSAFVLFTMAVGTVIVGSLLSGVDSLAHKGSHEEVSSEGSRCLRWFVLCSTPFNG